MASDAASTGRAGRNAKLLKIAGFVLAGIVAVGLLFAAFASSRYFTGAVEAELVAAMRDTHRRTLRFDGPLEISFWPSAGFKVGRIVLSEPGSDKEFASIDGASFSLAVAPLLNGRIAIEHCALDGLKAVVVRHADGTLNIDDLLGGEQARGPKPVLDVASVSLRDSTLSWVDEERGAATVVQHIGLSGVQLRVDGTAKSVQAAEVSLAASVGEMQAQLRLDGLAASPAALKADRAALDVAWKNAGSAVTVALAARLAAEPQQGSLALDGLAGDVGIVHPRLAHAVTLPLKGTFHARGGKGAGNFSMRLDDSTASLDLRVARFMPPALRFAAELDRLDVDRYLAPNPAETAAPAKESQADLSGLKNLELDGTAKIGSLRIAGLKTSNIRLEVRSAHGALDVRSIGGTVGK